MKTKKRITLYVNEKDYLNLRLKLLKIGKSVSQWFNELIKEFLG
jgi:hypothetical protein